MVIGNLVIAQPWERHHDDVGSGRWIVMMLGMVVFWGAVIVLVVWLLRGGLDRRREDPEEILRRRLAEGAISIEEYEQRRAALRGSPQTNERTVDPPQPGAG